MVALDDATGSLLVEPSQDSPSPLYRPPTCYEPLHSFALDKTRSYQQQYGDMYFLRLTKIRPAVDAAAAAAWEGTVIGGEEVKRVERVLDVRQGELCWVVGTVYMEMPLKPNVLDDVSKDRWIAAPISTQKYYSDDDLDQIMLEDDSGRIRLVGDLLNATPIVTGCIIAVMGTENSSGELEVIDIKFPDLPPQPARWALKKATSTGTTGVAAGDGDVAMPDVGETAGGTIAIVSGLNFSDTDASYSLELNLLLEYLLGEALAPTAQAEVARISRLIIAGNSICASTGRQKAEAEATDKKSAKKYGYDASSYNPLPSQLCDDFLSELLATMPVTLLPGSQDPANASYPQQPIHMAMFPRARLYGPDIGPAVKGKPGPAAGWLDAVTNPWEAEVEGWRILGTGGQNVDDVFRYVESDDRLGMMEAMCRWRCIAPTAPDTLWSYPFQESDPFVMTTCPHLYFVGCQPAFGTKLIDGPEGQRVRLISVPSFSETKELVLVDTETLEVTRVKMETVLERNGLPAGETSQSAAG